jgi:SCY1-like protein 2
MVPGLCESIDYAEVQGVLFPRVAVCIIHYWISAMQEQLTSGESLQLLFTKTRILSVKVATLVTFFTMVQTLDQVRFLTAPGILVFNG